MLSCLGRSLKEGNAKLLGYGGSIRILDFSLLLKVAFVANHQNFAIFVRIISDLLDPVALHLVIGGLACDIIDDYYTLGALVIGVGDCPKLFLACGIPLFLRKKGLTICILTFFESTLIVLNF